ncbi:MAG: hypothetical protein ABEK29_00640 [Bradymonadaceae bacterium]
MNVIDRRQLRSYIAGAVVAVVGMGVAIGACRHSSAPVDEEAAAETAASSSNEQQSTSDDSGGEASATKEACLGKVTPPTGAGGKQYLQEPAIAEETEIQTVVDRARQKLLERLCQGYRCETLAPEIQTWEIQQSGAYTC